MNVIILSLCVLLTMKANACGSYFITAKVILTKGFPYLIINPNTQSQIRLDLKFKETPKLSPYVDHTISAQVMVSSIDGTMAAVDSITNIKRVYTSAIDASQGTFIRALKKSKCSK